MAYKTIQFLVNVNEDAKPNAVVEFAIEFARREGAHLSALGIPQLVDFPIGRLLPLADAIIDQINDERLAKANSLGDHFDVSARLAGVTADWSVAQLAPEAARKAAVAASRVCDLVIAPKSKGVLSAEESLVEAVLFGAGRPVLIVPPEWEAGPLLDHVVIAWDGGARAARAVGDAMPLLEKAGRVEVVCVTSDQSGEALGAELARHLSRHDLKVSVTDLPLRNADAGRTLMDHLHAMRPSLFVMGAFAHAALLQHVIGGTTSLMLTDAKVPVLYSY
jgi:nucleotide-binding universal stress UspA family protein